VYDGEVLVLISGNDEKIVAATFSPKDREKILHIGDGKTIVVRGELYGIDSYIIKLRNCEID
jgi:hypothetical protein